MFATLTPTLHTLSSMSQATGMPGYQIAYLERTGRIPKRSLGPANRPPVMWAAADVPIAYDFIMEFLAWDKRQEEMQRQCRR